MPDIFPDDVDYVEKQLASYPYQIRLFMLKEYERLPTRREANTYLRVRRKEIAEKLGILPVQIQLDMDEEELRNEAERHVSFCLGFLLCNRTEKQRYNEICSYVKMMRLKPIDIRHTEEQEIETGIRVCELYRNAVNRMLDTRWWQPKLRKLHGQDTETAMIILGMVNQRHDLYASSFTVTRRKWQKAYQDQQLAQTSVVNQLGQRYTLKELSEKNVSNPKVRKAELMVRMRGFEEIADEYGHVGLFLTMTCPSKYHSTYSISGQRNPKWEGYTPWEGQQYLVNTYKKIRAKLHRNHLQPYGFRIAEPHHDGTPHWHLLLFVQPSDKQQVIDIFRHYCMEEDGNEQGADEYRFKVVDIDKRKGDTTGYIAKYVSKNIDGEGIEEGSYGEKAASGATRVDAWASCWAIRQFQQEGGASVTVWRELRRLKLKEAISAIFKEAHVAADRSDWKGYIKAMGGIIVKRADRPIKSLYKLVIDSETYEMKTSALGDAFARRLKGVVHEGIEVITRQFEWKVERTTRANAF